MMQAAAYGRLGADPKSISTKTGKAMTAASLAVDLVGRNSEDPVTEWLSVICFGRTADALLKHAKGDLISIAGRVQVNCYTAKDGSSRRELQIIADSVISSKSVRPRSKRRPSNNGTKTPGPSEPRDFNDDIPF